MSTFYLVVSTYVALYLAIWMHEAGHALAQVLCNQKLKYSYRCKNATFEQRQGQLESYVIPDL